MIRGEVVEFIAAAQHMLACHSQQWCVAYGCVLTTCKKQLDVKPTRFCVGCGYNRCANYNSASRLCHWLKHVRSTVASLDGWQRPTPHVPQ